MGLFDFLFGSSQQEEERERLNEINSLKQSDMKESTNTSLQNTADKEKAYLIVFTSRCRPCRLFVNEIKESGLNNYTVVDVDDDEDDLQAEFGVPNLPTTCLINEQGSIIKKWTGYDEKDPGQTKFVEYIKNSSYNIRPYSEAPKGLSPKSNKQNSTESRLNIEEQRSLGFQTFEQFSKATNRNVFTSSHLLFLQQFLGNVLFFFKHASDKSEYPTYMWNENGLYLGDESKVAYAIPFLWIMGMAKNDKSKFEIFMTHINDIYHIETEHISVEDLVQGIKKNGFYNFNPDFNLEKNRIILSKFYCDSACMLRFIYDFGDKINTVDLLPSMNNRVHIFDNYLLDEFVNDMVGSWRNGTILK